MAEYTAIAAQTVAAGGNILLTEVPVQGGCNVIHRDGAGVVTIRGNTNQCRARYKVSFGANIAVPTGGTAEAISVSLSVSGEPLSSATAIITPAALNEYGNVYVSAFIDVPRGCCTSIAIENTSTQSIVAQNANLVVERVA